MCLIGLYSGALWNLHVTGSDLIYLVPGQGSENVGSKCSGGALPARPGRQPFASWKISLKHNKQLRLGTTCLVLGLRWKQVLVSDILVLGFPAVCPALPHICLCSQALAVTSNNGTSSDSPCYIGCMVHFCHPPGTARLHPVPLHLPPQPAQPIQQPRSSPVGTTQKWQLLSALAGLVHRSLVGKFYCGN